MAPTGNKRRKDQLDAPSVSPIPVTTIQNGRIGQIGSHRTTLEETWKELEGGLKTVFDLEKAFKDPFKLPYMTYYTHVYNLCTSSSIEKAAYESAYYLRRESDSVTLLEESANGEPIKLSRKIEEFVRDHLIRSCQDMHALRGNELLRVYTKKWADFRFSAKVAHGFCSYLNENVLRRHAKLSEASREIFPVYGLCLKEWRDVVLTSFQESLLRSVSDVITADRNGGLSDSLMVRSFVDCLVDLGLTLDVDAHAGVPATAPLTEACKNRGLQVYQKFLEAPFLQRTRQYYNNESREFLARNSVAKYVEKVHLRVKEEGDRCMKYLHASTCANLIETVEDVMISQQMEKLRAEFMIYLAEEKVEELTAMYALISRVPIRMGELYSAVETHIRQKGLQALAENPTEMMEDPRLFVTAILEVHRACSPLITKSFRNEKEFRAAFDKGFSSFVNNNSITAIAKSSAKTSELFARYCDLMLKKGAINLSEQDLEGTLVRFMVAFQYIENKDVFQRHYQKCLSRRLILGLSVSDDAEVSIISKLKLVAGWEYVSKMQRMFQDMALSTEMNFDFREANQAGRHNWKFEFAVQILASGSWPLSAGTSIHIPVDLERPLVVFNEFYANKYNGRKLSWVFSNSRCEINTNCFKTKHILTVSATQASILLAFNAAETALSIGDLRTTIGMLSKTPVELTHFKQILLLIIKSKILVINDEKENVEEKDLAYDHVKVKLNSGYTGKRTRLNLNLHLRGEQKQEEESANRGVEDDRKAVIQAAIVRIMKMRKELKHQQLIGQTMEMLSQRFKPNVAAIKKNIEIMIEKEYIRRADQERDLYIYVA